MSASDEKRMLNLLRGTRQIFLMTKRQDMELISKLISNRFIKEEKTKLTRRFDSLNKQIEKDLNTGEQLIEQGFKSPKEMDKVFQYLFSFSDNTLGDFRKRTMFNSRKDKSSYLTELLKRLHKQGFEGETVTAIEKRAEQIQDLYLNPEFRALSLLAEKLGNKVKNHFKIKRGIINLNRPKINETVTIDGKYSVQINIFFASNLTSEIVADTIENYSNILSNTFDQEMKKTGDTLILQFKSKIEKKILFLQTMNSKEIEQYLLNQLKEVVLRTLINHKELILTPKFKYQLKIISGRPGSAFMDPYSRIDNYLIGIDISTVLMFFLIEDGFFELIPGGLVSSVINILASKRQISMNMTKSAYNAPMSDLQKTFLKLRELNPDHRSASLYNYIVHETTHAFDVEFLNKTRTVIEFIYEMLQKSNKTNDHNTMNLNASLLHTMQFYLTCRIEGITQFKEYLTIYEDKITNEKYYFLTNPIPSLGTKRIIDSLNYVLTSIEQKINRKEGFESLPNVNRFGYEFGHIMAMTIFFSDCKRKKIDLVIVPTHSLNRLIQLFPYLQGVISGYSNIQKIPENSPSKILLDNINKNNNDYFRDVLNKNRIMNGGVNDIAKLIQDNKPFYMFRPPINVMNETFSKIAKTKKDPFQFFDMYERACDTLGIKDKLISARQISILAEKYYQAEAEIHKKRGFLP